MSVNGILSLFSFCDVCSADWPRIIVGRDDGPLEQQKQDSHVCRRNRTFPVILGKIRVITTKTTKSKKLRIRNGILDK